jgi:uncharacterized protein YbjT (DUF2867 family)
MSIRLHVVTGATGHAGSAVAERLLDSGRKVRVVGREAARLARFTARGAEAAVGSLDDPAFVGRALQGAAAVFAMIPPLFAPGYRAFQRRVVEAIGAAVDGARPAHVVALSSIGADVASGNGPIAGLYDLERRLESIPGVATLAWRAGYFFENHLAGIPMIKQAGIYGSALRADLKMAQIATRDIGDAAARSMLALDWSSSEVRELQGQRDLTMQEAASALGRAIGKPDLRYIAFSYEDAQHGMVAAGLPSDLAALYVEMSRGFNDGAVRSTQPRTGSTTTATSIEWFAENVFAPAFRG